MKSKIKQSSFRLQLSLVLVSLTLVVSGVSLLFLKNQQANFLKTNLQQQGNAITTLVAEDIAKLIYLNDPDIAADITLRLKEIPEVYAAYFFDTSYQPILIIKNDQKELPESSLGINSNVSYQGLKLGYAHFVFFSPMLSAQFSSAEQHFLQMTFMMALLSLLIIFYIDKRFIVRLSELSQALKYATQNKDFTKTLSVRKEDEIDQARANFNLLINMVREKTDDLQFKANHDSLTGLYGRHFLLQEIENTLHENLTKHALFYIDLDQFKVINDTCGHYAGDLLLKSLSAEILHFVTQKADSVFGRIGGDEFILLLRNREQSDVAATAQELQQLIRAFSFKVEERTFLVGASIGIITYGDTQTSAQDLLSAADAACYQAKNQGRDKIITYDIADSKLAKEKSMMSWVSQLYNALEYNRFELYMQPIVSLDDISNNFEHYEVLLRLSVNDEPISPEVFIPIAERYGLSKHIDLWVVEHICAELTVEFLAKTKLVSINLSVDTLMDSELILKIEQAIVKASIPFDKLCFEITETGIISNLSQVQNFIEHFSEKGVRFSLDDFGSGMSSFGYLSQLPVTYLKIDGGFVKDIVNNPVMREMVTSMNRIGQLTNKQVIAEYIETPEAIDILKEIGVNYGQGYYFSRPQPAKNFIKKG